MHCLEKILNSIQSIISILNICVLHLIRRNILVFIIYAYNEYEKWSFYFNFYSRILMIFYEITNSNVLQL